MTDEQYWIKIGNAILSQNSSFITQGRSLSLVSDAYALSDVLINVMVFPHVEVDPRNRMDRDLLTDRAARLQRLPFGSAVAVKEVTAAKRRHLQRKQVRQTDLTLALRHGFPASLYLQLRTREIDADGDLAQLRIQPFCKSRKG